MNNSYCTKGYAHTDFSNYCHGKKLFLSKTKGIYLKFASVDALSSHMTYDLSLLHCF